MQTTHTHARLWMVVLAFATSWVTACRNESQDTPPPSAASTPAPAAATVNASKPATPATPAIGAADRYVPPTTSTANDTPDQKQPQGQERVQYGLAAHLARAELRTKTSQLFDYGVPGDAKYTLGGWLGFYSMGRAFDGPAGAEGSPDAGTRALVLRGKSMKLAVPSDNDGEKLLVIRLRGFAKTALTVHVNDQALGDHPLDGKDFQILSLTLPAGLIRRGENSLELRVQRGGPTTGMTEAGFAIDYVTLAEPGTPSAELVPPAPSELRPNGDNTALRVPSGLRLGYALEIPPGARLRASLHADKPAKLIVLVRSDEDATTQLAALDAKPTATDVDVDLGGFAGKTVRIDLAADGGELSLDKPRIVTLDAAGAPSGTNASALTRKPIKNAIIVLVDTLRADKLSPYNANTKVRTPALSRFLQGASVMRSARSQENWTKPSVATLLSSLYPWQHNTYTDEAVLPASVELLPEYLHKRGFYTGAFIANGYCSEKFGFNQGFNTYRNYIHEGRPSVAQRVAADVLDWLDSRPKDKPFFLYVHTIDVHVPYIPPDYFLKMYDPAPYSGPIDFRGNGELLEKIKIGRQHVEPRDKEHLEALYNAEITYHDVHFGSIIDGLVKRGLSDDTMVVLTADHGEEFWDHGSVGHGHSVYDELLHVPMILRIPGVTDGKVEVSSSVGLVDVAPTLLETLGEPVPEEMSGTSFLPELLGATADAPRVVASGFMTGWRTLGVGHLKLVQRGLDRIQLFDIGKDPGETQDIASEHPIAVRYARGLLGLALANKSRGNGAAVTYKQEKTKIDATTEAELRSLGYVGSSRH